MAGRRLSLAVHVDSACWGDDYNLPGVRRAFEEFFSTRADPLIALPWGQAIVVRIE
jgi:hypothetical protein